MNNSNIIFKHFLTNVNASNCYIAGCPESKNAVIIDPSEYSDSMRKFISEHGLNLEYIFITHNHFDHNQAVSSVLDQFSAKVINNLNSILEDSMEIICGTLKFSAFPTPGHTADSVTYIINDQVFVGDLLFAGAVGGTSGLDNHLLEISQIKEKILTLPDNFRIFPGHGPATTVRIEKLYNPFIIDK